MLVIGLVLVVAAIFLLNQGPQLLIPVAETAGLTSHYVKENVILPPTVFSIPSSNYTFASANLNGGSEVTGSLQVASGRQVAFYVMDEGNFSLWQQRRPSIIVLAQPAATMYNFTFTPYVTGTYLFIFDNQDNGARSVIFSLSTLENVTVVSPFVKYAGLELLLIGAGLSYLGLKVGRKEHPPPPAPAPTPEISGWKCKYCGAVNEDYNAQFCGSCDRSRG
jgi:hypothetical protein